MQRTNCIVCVRVLSKASFCDRFEWYNRKYQSTNEQWCVQGVNRWQSVPTESGYWFVFYFTFLNHFHWITLHHYCRCTAAKIGHNKTNATEAYWWFCAVDGYERANIVASRYDDDCGVWWDTGKESDLLFEQRIAGNLLKPTNLFTPIRGLCSDGIVEV